MPESDRQLTSPEFATADRLHSAAIHLLRRLRSEDRAAGLSGPRLSALSVVVFRGPISMGDLADAEQVRAPTMTRLVSQLAREGLVIRVADTRDKRVQFIRATPRGKRLLEQGRARRVALLSKELEALSQADRQLLARAAGLLEMLARPKSTGPHKTASD